MSVMVPYQRPLDQQWHIIVAYGTSVNSGKQQYHVKIITHFASNTNVTIFDFFLHCLCILRSRGAQAKMCPVDVSNFEGMAGSEDFACATLPTTPLDFQGKV